MILELRIFAFLNVKIRNILKISLIVVSDFELFCFLPWVTALCYWFSSSQYGGSSTLKDYVVFFVDSLKEGKERYHHEILRYKTRAIYKTNKRVVFIPLLNSIVIDFLHHKIQFYIKIVYKQALKHFS